MKAVGLVRGSWWHRCKAKVLNGDRVRFEVAGGNHRLIAAFKFPAQIAFVKFIGTHAEYDRVNALSVSLF